MAARHGQLVTMVTARVMAPLINRGKGAVGQGAGSITPIGRVSMASHNSRVRDVWLRVGREGKPSFAKARKRLTILLSRGGSVKWRVRLSQSVG